MTVPPSATPAPPKKSGPGCLALAILLPLVILGGIIVGTVLSRPDDPPEELIATVAEGTVDGTPWRVDAVRDVEGEVCAFLYEDGAQVTGGCDRTPQSAAIGTTTVVFGQVAPDVAAVQIVLSNAETVDADTVEPDDIDGRFYAEAIEGIVTVEHVVPHDT